MKKSLILLVICVFTVFNACSRQEKMNTDIFVERFIATAEKSVIAEERFASDGKDVFFFKDIGGTEFVCELSSDEHENVKKICLAGNKTDKAGLMKHYSGLIINTYAPNEDAKAVLSNLFNNKWDYYDTLWYRYSSMKSDEGLFFSIENMRFSTESDAELTLKQNDITFR